MNEAVLEAARAGDGDAFAALVAPYRRELRALCYRLSGSLHDADDLLQEALLRAWQGLPRFEGRSSLRTWLYRVATHACLDALERRSARVLPAQLGPPVAPSDVRPGAAGEVTWLEPCPDALYVDLPPSPESVISAKQSVQLAFLVALQTLAPRQRAVLILRDVVGLDAAECASLLETTVPSVNSALQRARETVAARRPLPQDDVAPPPLLARYVAAWERADPRALLDLLREDATLAMPPMPHWLAGAANIVASLEAMVLVPAAAGRFVCFPLEANGAPAFAVYARDPGTGELRAQAIHVLAIVDGRIAEILAFLDPRAFADLGLPTVRTGS